ncbi:MAG: alpha/beta hydrolase [Actinomycetota bacterium]
MKYVEKDLGPVEVDPDAEAKQRLSRLPGFVSTFFVRVNLKKIRDGMGGESRDITRRTVCVADRVIAGNEGDIRVRTYAPEGETARPLLMFHHGGGWIGGSVEAVDDFCKGVADQGDCVVISVDYRLAPEHRYPAAIEDSYKALQWAVGHAGELGIDPARVSVAGDSAGGNISAVLAVMANDRGDVSVHRQVLIYPAIDNTFENLETNLPAAHSAFGAVLKLYLGDKRLANEPYVSPNTYDDLGALPDALIAVGELDDLRATSFAYAEALDEAGVGVEFILYKNANHAFIDNTGNNSNADDLVVEVARVING